MMSSEQQATIEIVQNDIRSAIAYLSHACVAGIESLAQAKENLQRARDILDGVLLEGGTPGSKKAVINEIIRDLAHEDRGNSQ